MRNCFHLITDLYIGASPVAMQCNVGCKEEPAFKCNTVLFLATEKSLLFLPMLCNSF